ncbi:MAG: hypothetical protein IPM29_26700 [Planctomycetes bacterium]|nr:hypothetical protein [Planctomycetota bacterium]
MIVSGRTRTVCASVVALSAMWTGAVARAQDVTWWARNTSMYQIHLFEGTWWGADTVPSDTPAPWTREVQRALQPGQPPVGRVFTMVQPSALRLGGGDGADLSPGLSARVDHHETEISVSGPPGMSCSFYVNLYAACATLPVFAPHPTLSGRVTIDVLRTPVSPDVELVYTGQFADSRSATVLIELGPGQGASMTVASELAVGVVPGSIANQVGVVWQLDVIPVAASWTPHRYGCPGSSTWVPDLAVVTLPSPGRTYRIRLVNAPVAAPRAVMMIGVRGDLLGGAVPLPVELGFAGMPGCWLAVDPLAFEDFALASGGWEWSFAMPGDSSLLGIWLFHQAAIPDPGANAAGLVLSSAYRAIIGSVADS